MTLSCIYCELQGGFFLSWTGLIQRQGGKQHNLSVTQSESESESNTRCHYIHAHGCSPSCCSIMQMHTHGPQSEWLLLLTSQPSSRKDDIWNAVGIHMHMWWYYSGDKKKQTKKKNTTQSLCVFPLAGGLFLFFGFFMYLFNSWD